jgi:hypothetical protein
MSLAKGASGVDTYKARGTLGAVDRSHTNQIYKPRFWGAIGIFRNTSNER